jgi:hypothetical protein
MTYPQDPNQPWAQQPAQTPPGGYPGAAPAGYGQQPGYPANYPGGQQSYGPPSAPGTVVGAFVIWLIGSILTIIGGVVILIVGIAGGSMISSLFSTAGADGSGAATGFAVVFGIIGLIVAGLAVMCIIFASKMKNGANWARTTLTVLGGIATLLIIIGLFNASGSSLAIQGILAVAYIIGLILPFLPASNAYFQATANQPR